MTMASVYAKVKSRERQAERERRLEAEFASGAGEAEIRRTKLATIKLQFWLAAAGPSMKREAAPLKASFDKSLDEMNKAIEAIERALAQRKVSSFQIDDVCRWTGERLIVADGSRMQLLVRSPWRVRFAAIDSLLALDVENLRRRGSEYDASKR